MNWLFNLFRQSQSGGEEKPAPKPAARATAPARTTPSRVASPPEEETWKSPGAQQSYRQNPQLSYRQNPQTYTPSPGSSSSQPSEREQGNWLEKFANNRSVGGFLLDMATPTSVLRPMARAGIGVYDAFQEGNATEAERRSAVAQQSVDAITPMTEFEDSAQVYENLLETRRAKSPSQLRREEEAKTRLLEGLENYTSQALTHDRWNSLTPRQQAAVEFNSALLRAVDADKALKGANITREADYDARVAGLFGEDGGSETYAPNTLRLLETLGIGDTARDDLDNYLSLNALVTDEELEFLGKDDATRKDQMRGGNARLANASNVSRQTQNALTSALRRGESLLRMFNGPDTLVGTREYSGEAIATLDELFNVMVAGLDSFENPISPGEFSDWIKGLGSEFGITPNEAAGYFEGKLRELEYELPRLEEGGADPASLPDISAIRRNFFLGGE